MKHIALVTVMVLIGSIVFAQSSNRVVLVNVDEAQESIENLRILNGTMEADSAGKQLIRDELRSEIAALEATVRQIDAHLEVLWQDAGMLHSLMQASVNPENRRSLLTELEENRSHRYDLENHKRAMLETLREKKQHLYTVGRQITRNVVDIRTNDEKIAWIQRCIEHTRARYPEVENAVAEARSLNSEIAGYLAGLESGHTDRMPLSMNTAP